MMVDGNTEKDGKNCRLTPWGPDSSYTSDTQSDNPDSVCSSTATATAGCRCCKEGKAASSECEDQNCKAWKYDDCNKKCTEEGGRLCSEDEILNKGEGKGTGCTYDYMHVWTSTTCTDPATTAVAQKRECPVTVMVAGSDNHPKKMGMYYRTTEEKNSRP